MSPSGALLIATYVGGLEISDQTIKAGDVVFVKHLEKQPVYVNRLYKVDVLKGFADTRSDDAVKTVVAECYWLDSSGFKSFSFDVSLLSKDSAT